MNDTKQLVKDFILHIKLSSFPGPFTDRIVKDLGFKIIQV